MRVLLMLFGLVQVGVAILFASWSDEIVEVLTTPEPLEAALAIDGVVQTDDLLDSPSGEPFAFAHMTIRGPERSDGSRAVLWAGTVGDPEITLLTQEGEATVLLSDDLDGWKEVPVEASVLTSLDALDIAVPGWEAWAVDEGDVRVEVLALRKMDRVLVEKRPDGSLKSLWYGGSRIREEALTNLYRPFRETYDAFLWLTVVLTMASGVFCLGGGFTRA